MANAQRVEDDDDSTQVPGSEDTLGITIDTADLEERRPPQRDADDPDRGAKRGGESRDDDDAGLDARSALDEGQDPDALADFRKKKREERIRKREARRAREDDKDRRIEQLEGIVQGVLAKTGERDANEFKSTLSNIEIEQQNLVTQYNEAKALKAKAFKDRDNPESGSIIVEADEIISASKDRYAFLDAQKGKMLAAARSQQAGGQRGPDPAVAKHATAFMDRHKWYDRNGGDRDSARMLTIDKKMYAEGWDPRTPGYWEELEARASEAMPHRFRDGGGRDDDDLEDDPRPRKRQITGGGGGGESLPAGKVHIPADYVKNLKEAGMWDDIKTRNRMLRRYVTDKARHQQGGK